MDTHNNTRPHTSSRRHRTSSRSISRSRSRSPSYSYRRDEDRKRSQSHRHRDREEDDRHEKRRKSHHRDYHRSRKHDDETRRARSREAETAPRPLPFGSRQLSKRDLMHYEPVLRMYLDIQKNLILEDLSEAEIKGRWKSFMGKWNRGELAEGWYDPSTLEKARSSIQDASPSRDRTRPPSRSLNEAEARPGDDRIPRRDSPEYDNEDDDEIHGPSLPQQQFSNIEEEEEEDSHHTQRRSHNQKSGPTIPRTEDLQLQRELAQSSHQSERSHSRAIHRQAVSSHKSELKHIQEEVAPRAEPGSRERRLEKRQERAVANRSFAQSARGGSPVQGVGDDELMGDGGGGDSLEAMKREREKETRKKNERELRREEMLRARVAEREERMEAYRRKEDETMSVLKALAKQRFG